MTSNVSRNLLFIIAGLLITACGGKEETQKETGPAVPVRTVVVEPQSLSWQSSYAGTVQPIESVRLSTKLMGWVDKIYFREGAAVQKGQLLIQIRSEDLLAKQEQAKAAISEASAYLNNVQANYERTKSLYDSKAATQKEMDDIETALSSAKARQQTAENMKAEVTEMIRYTTLRAPFDGIVARKMIEEGDLANPGQPIMEFENTNQVKIIAKVPETSVHDLQVGMPVHVRIRASSTAANSKDIKGEIKRIVPAADPMSRQFDIHVLMDNSDGQIKSGMFARVFVGDQGEQTMLVPATAILKRGQLHGVFIVKPDNSAQLRWIRTGVSSGDMIEILSGINPGERIVTEGFDQLSDGQPVEVRS